MRTLRLYEVISDGLWMGLPLNSQLPPLCPYRLRATICETLAKLKVSEMPIQVAIEYKVYR